MPFSIFTDRDKRMIKAEYWELQLKLPNRSLYKRDTISFGCKYFLADRTRYEACAALVKFIARNQQPEDAEFAQMIYEYAESVHQITLLDALRKF